MKTIYTDKSYQYVMMYISINTQHYLLILGTYVVYIIQLRSVLKNQVKNDECCSITINVCIFRKSDQVLVLCK